MNRRLRGVCFASVFAGLGLLAAALPSVPAADHLDAPRVKKDTRLDINDVYVFQSPANPANTVLIMTVCPVAGIVSDTSFSPNGGYEFKIDTNADAKEDITFKIDFGKADANGVQDVVVKQSPAAGGAILAQGKTRQNLAVAGGGQFRADVFDDPFFFDLVAFQNGLAFTDPGDNFFFRLDVCAIVLEIPSSRFGVNNIGVWARTTQGAAQIDRMARPAINTVFIPKAQKDLFNKSKPSQDARFRDEMIAVLLSLGRTQADAEGLANFLLPDIMTVDVSNAGGFPNGRRLEDDVIDIELQIITGNMAATDGVDNDNTFLTTFPYLAPPN